MTGPAGGHSIGGYQLEAKLGQGGMGTVYRAHHPAAPGRPVALKVLSGAPGPDGLERFKREVAALVAAGGHPGIVRILAGSLETQPPFFVMELVGGESLEKALARGLLEVRRAVELVRAVADAIAFAHGHGLLHRDLKPANVLQDEEGRPRVCDFGVARLASAERLTRTGVFVGSPIWAAPEQLAGDASSQDARTDVHGLGALLWACLAGASPYEAQVAQAGRRVLGTSPPLLRTAAPGAPRELEAVCAHALDERPERRYATAAELRDDLDRWLEGEVPLAVAARPSAGARARRAALFALVALAALVLVALVGVFLEKRGREQRTRALVAAVESEGTILDAARAGLAELERTGGTREEIARLRALLRRRELEERIAGARPARPGDAASLAALEAAVDAALELPDRASLSGERPGLALGLAVLDARGVLDAHGVLDARDALAPARPNPGPPMSRLTPADLAAVASREVLLVEKAERLAAARLAASPGDPGGRLLRARVALARVRAPVRAAGPGELGVAASLAEPVVADLEAAAADPGTPGLEADWLLADLLLGAGPAGEARARAALERARSRHPGSPARAALERALAVSPDAQGLGTLLGALLADAAAPEKAREAAVALSRFGARLGIPGAFEHPELAGDPGLAERLVLREPPGSRPPVGPEVWKARGRLWNFADKPGEAPDRAAHGVELTRRAVEELAVAPFDPNLIDAFLERPARPGNLVLAALANGGDPSIRFEHALSYYDRGYRNVPGGPDPEVVEAFGATTGPEACAAFDARIEAELEAEPVLAALRRVDRARVDEAAAACRGARRIEELEELAPGARAGAPVALEAVRGLEAFVRTAPASGTVLRARLRRALVPGAFGAGLARLDLARAARILRVSAADARSVWAERGLVHACFMAASQAAQTEGASETEGVLFELGRWLLHERAIALGRSMGDPAVVESCCTEEVSFLDLDPRFRGLLRDPSRRERLAATADDRARFAADEYHFRFPPTAWLRPEAVPEDSRIDRLVLRPGKVETELLVELGVTNTGAETWGEGYWLHVYAGKTPGAARLENRELGVEGVGLSGHERIAPGASCSFAFSVRLPEPGKWRLTFVLDSPRAAVFGHEVCRTVEVPARR